ncbi:helix-turn-helix domain-containing protein [Bacillus thuringiensis]|uniref:Transcriptional regulator n=1 Tax=Bacillus mycoides TaxID=1405 RepID=A0A1W6AIJ5_BACMY|nr:MULTISPECIES: helix-turn-helix transcriptional regulator [Bacillus cereus group]ANN35777.1 XRE family transcriptional regulator [Bacillus thuringiensis serovar coreanensis]ARJ25642.1 transcriptional regulator [Bacillus mycoides]UIJ70181.1 helix-turn-helix transcriptional regulator [Bacillus cereus]
MFFKDNKTPLKKWLDRHGIEQQKIARASDISLPTITKACRDKTYIPTPIIMKKLLKAIRKVDPYAQSQDFWKI